MRTEHLQMLSDHKFLCALCFFFSTKMNLPIIPFWPVLIFMATCDSIFMNVDEFLQRNISPETTFHKHLPHNEFNAFPCCFSNDGTGVFRKLLSFFTQTFN